MFIVIIVINEGNFENKGNMALLQCSLAGGKGGGPLLGIASLPGLSGLVLMGPPETTNLILR